MTKDELKDYIKTYSQLANHSLGQNFLINFDVAEWIVSMLGVEKKDKILEIGAGLGSLSIYLSKYSNDLTLIDIDSRMVDFLKNKLLKDRKKTNIKKADILQFDVNKYNKIIGNIPYYITSNIIEHLLLYAEKADTIVLMTQKEAILRLLSIKSKDVCPLSLLIKDLCDVELLCSLSAASFVPSPRVDSIVFKLKINERGDKAIKENYKVMTLLFQNRRKTILNNLSNLLNDKNLAKAMLEQAKINPRLRPEQIKINEYYLLTNQLLNYKQVLE